MRRGMLSVVRVVDTTCVPGRRLLEACASLGVGVRRVGRGDAVRVARRIAPRLARGGTIALLTGVSGSGKSTMLRALRDVLISRGVPCAHAASDDGGGGCLLDCLGQTGEDAARMLAGAGLGDALLWARRPGELSDGERARFAIALAWSRAVARGGGVLTVDEFASVLDRRSARALCVTIRRMVERDGRVSVIAASAHEDVRAWLRPHVVAECENGCVRVRGGGEGGGDAHRGSAGVGARRGTIALSGGHAGDARPRDRGVGRPRSPRG